MSVPGQSPTVPDEEKLSLHTTDSLGLNTQRAGPATSSFIVRDDKNSFTTTPGEITLVRATNMTDDPYLIQALTNELQEFSDDRAHGDSQSTRPKIVKTLERPSID